MPDPGLSAPETGWQWDFFVSYTAADEQQAEWIATELTRQGHRVLFQKWHFVPGTNWVALMLKGTKRSERTIAVLSPAYLDSKFATFEWQEAWRVDPLGQQSKLISVLIEPTEVSGPLAQAVRVDIAGLGRDAARPRLLAGIAAALGGSAAPPIEPLFSRAGSRASRSRIPSVPSQPSQVVDRFELLAKVQAMLAPGGIAALVGMGGSGKTTLARAIATDPAIRERFPGGVQWLNLGREPDLSSSQARLAELLGGGRPDPNISAGLDELRKLAAGTANLIVLDDVWDREHLEALNVAIAPSTLLITTRNRDVLHWGAVVCPVDPVDDTVARAIVAAWAGRDPDELPAEAARVLARCGGLPLALAAAGGLVAAGGSWADVAEQLSGPDVDRLRLDFPDYPYPTLLAVFDVGVEALAPAVRERYFALVVLDGRGPVPLEVPGLLWTEDDKGTTELLTRLARRSLVLYDQEAGTVTLHDLQFEYLRRRIGSPAVQALHGRLAHALLDRWGRLDMHLPALGEAGFGEDPLEQYGVANLVPHLIAAGEESVVHDLLASEWHSFEVFGSGARPTNLWFDAHNRAGDLEGYLRDVEAARKLAEAGTDSALEAGEIAESVGLEIRYALLAASQSSIAANVPIWAPTALVKRGRWSTRRALAHAATIPPGGQRASALAELIELVPQPERPAIAVEMFETAGSEFDLVADKIMYLPDELREERIAALLETARAAPGYPALEKLIQVADLLPADRRKLVQEEAMTKARNMVSSRSDHRDDEASALTALASLQPAGSREALLREALSAARAIKDAEARCKALIKIAGLTSGLHHRLIVNNAHRAARKVKDRVRLSKSLLAVAGLLSGRRRERVLDQAVAIACSDVPSMRRALQDLADYVQPTTLERLMQAAREIGDPDDRAWALTDLARKTSEVIREELLTDALAAAKAIPITGPRGGQQRAMALASVAQELPTDRGTAVLMEALSVAALIDDRYDLARTRAALARFVPPPLSERLQNEALDAVRAIPTASRRASALHKIAVLLPEPRRTHELGIALDLVLEQSKPSDIVNALRRMGPDLPPPLALRAVDTLLEILKDRNPQVNRLTIGDALGLLVERIPAEDRDHLLWAVVYIRIFDPWRQASVLRRLGPALSAEQVIQLRNDASELDNELGNELGSALITAALLPWTPASDRDVLIVRVRDFEARWPYAEHRSQLLILLAPSLPEPRRSAVLQDADAAANDIASQIQRARALTELARELPTDKRQAMLSTALAVARDGLLWGMSDVARVADELLPATWKDFWRLAMLTAAAEGRSKLSETLRGAASELHRIGGDKAISEALRALDDAARWWP